MSLSKSIMNILLTTLILVSGFLLYLNLVLEYEDSETITISDDESVYYIQGFIGPLQLSTFLDRKEDIERVVFDSTGGYIWDAGILAYYIHKYELTTVVEENSICYSSCVLLFQAGKKRIAHVNSTFMIHSARFEADGVMYNATVGTLVYTSLLRLYGFDEEFLNNISPDRGDFYFDAVTAEEYGLVTDLVLE